MTDIALIFDPATLSADFALADGGLATDEGLLTAIVISLFTDARARPDDVLPQDGADRRGWWGDAFNDDAGDGIGSRRWLLVREKLTEATALKLRDIDSEALAWLVADSVVSEVIIETRLIRPNDRYPTGAIAETIFVTRPNGPARLRFDFVWDATTRSLAA